jgi:hypothetical protein
VVSEYPTFRLVLRSSELDSRDAAVTAQKGPQKKGGVGKKTTHLLLHCHLQQEHYRSGQILEISNYIFGGFSNGSVGRKGLLQHHVQLLHVHFTIFLGALRAFKSKRVVSQLVLEIRVCVVLSLYSIQHYSRGVVANSIAVRRNVDSSCRLQSNAAAFDHQAANFCFLREQFKVQRRWDDDRPLL